MSNSVHKSLFSSVLNSVCGRFGLYFIQFLSLAILSRIFTPEDFGIYASLFAIFLLFQLLGEAGLGPAIINKDGINSRDRDNLFGNVFCISLFVALLFLSLSGLFSDFYGINADSDYAIFFSVAVFFYSLNVVSLSFLQSERKFISISVAESLSEIISLLVVVLLCMLKKEPYYLSVKLAVYSFIRFVLIYIQSGKTKQGRPNLRFDAWVLSEYWVFAKYQVGHTFVSYLSRNIDTVLVAKFFGSAVIGPYDRAYQLMRYPLLLISFSIAPAIQPVLKGGSKDREQVVQSINLLLLTLFSLSGTIAYFVFSNAEIIVLVILGDQWEVAAIYLKLFSIAIPPQVVVGISGGVFQAYEKGRELLFSSATGAVLMIAAVFAGVMMLDVKIMIMLLVVAFYLYMFICFYLLYVRTLNAGYFEFIKLLYYLIAPVAVITCIDKFVLSLFDYGESFNSAMLLLVCVITVLSFVYIPIRKVLVVSRG